MTPKSEHNNHIIFSEKALTELRSLPPQRRQATLGQIEQLDTSPSPNRSPPFTEWCAAILNGHVILYLPGDERHPLYVGRIIKLTAVVRSAALGAKRLLTMLDTLSDLVD